MATEANEPSIVVDLNMVLPVELEQAAAMRAVEERASNAPQGGGAYELAVARAKLWRPGRVLRVRFLDGSASVQQMALEAAQEWTQYANLTLVASDDFDAELRVSFDPAAGCWSFVGTDALLRPTDMATINLGILGRPTAPSDWRKYVLHEFGHAIGCVHEHQTPIAGIKWNRPVVYDYYWEHYRWPKSKVDLNVFFVMDAASTNHSANFDPDSIMVYPIPREHTLDGYAVEWRSELSPMDKIFIAEVYPHQEESAHV